MPDLSTSASSNNPTGTTTTTTTTTSTPTTQTFYDFKPLDQNGQPYDFAQLRGKVVLIVNTASKCGFTPQLAGLEKLYQDVRQHLRLNASTAAAPACDTPMSAENRFVILAFPCNQFGGQEPGSQEEIETFYCQNYKVNFPIFQKIKVNGDDSAPLYTWLKSQQAGVLGLRRVKWNFEKFLVSDQGVVLNRWASTTKPESLKSEILSALKLDN